MEDPSHQLLVPLLQNYPLTPRFFASIALQSKKTSDGNTTSEDVASGLLGLAGTGNDDVGGLGLRLGLGTRAGVDGSLRAGGRSGLGVLAADRSDRVDDSASLFFFKHVNTQCPGWEQEFGCCFSYLDDSARAVGDGEGGGLSDDVLLVVELEGGRLRAVRDVLVHDTGSGGNGSAVLRGDKASGGSDKEGGAGEHLC